MSGGAEVRSLVGRQPGHYLEVRGTTPTNGRLESEASFAAFLEDYYRDKEPSILGELDSCLDRIGARPDDWDGCGSKQPQDTTILRAKDALRTFFRAVTHNGYVWTNPTLSSDEEGDVRMDWYKGEHELHVVISEKQQEVIKVWGANIDSEMHVGCFDKPNYVALWDWLVHG